MAVEADSAAMPSRASTWGGLVKTPVLCLTADGRKLREAAQRGFASENEARASRPRNKAYRNRKPFRIGVWSVSVAPGVSAEEESLRDACLRCARSRCCGGAGPVALSQ